MSLRYRMAAFLALLATPLQGETILVRSGEHATFSRLVLQLEEPAAWHLGRTEDGYALQIARPDISFDLAQVFDLIPRSRIQDVSDMSGARLALAVAPGNFASGFEIRPGTIVLDVTTGSAPADSPFEAPFAADSAVVQEPAPDPPHEPSASLRLPNRPPNADAMLGYYWAGLATQAPSAGAPAAPPATARDAAPPDPRIAAAEVQLLEQLGRAASQGLVTMALPGDAPPAESADTTPTGGRAPEAVAAGPPDDHIALRSQTVFDRDADGGPAVQQLNPDGVACLSVAEVDVGAWVGEGPVALQIGSAQRHLVGEFDRPSPDATLALARLYLALGMGAEVAALFDALGVAPPGSDDLRAMAAVVDDLPLPEGARLPLMADCDSPVALWALLANPGLGRGDAFNTNAVLRGFSQLPLGLRLLLGPRLVERLIALDAQVAARAVRDAITRAPGDHFATVGLIDADIEMARGAPAAAALALGQIIAEDGTDAPRATVLYIDSMLATGAVIDPATLESVAALAFEHRDEPDGPALARAHVLAAASAARFDRAFEALAQMPKGSAPEFVAATTATLLGQLAATPDDVVFATEYFQKRSLYLQQSDWPLKMQVAGRLLELGFPAEARQVLGAEAVRLEAGRLLRAQAAIAQGNGAAALAEIAGLSGDEAAALRADALRLSGDHDAARRAYLLVNAPGQAGTEAWIAGAWPEAAALGSPAQRALLGALGLGVSAAPGPAEAPGSLAAARELLAESQRLRAALDLALAESADN